MEEIGSDAMLTTKSSADFAPDVNIRECVICMSMQNVNKAAHSGFENQGRCHQKYKNGSFPTDRNYFLFKKGSESITGLLCYCYVTLLLIEFTDIARHSTFQPWINVKYEFIYLFTYSLIEVMIQPHNRHMSFSLYISALAVTDTISLLIGE